jgi:5-methylcytosine-specific restriction endonuclease McrA
MAKVLFLDKSGQPLDWGTWRDAVEHYAKDHVLWELGDKNRESITFRGGFNCNGDQSKISVAPIIALNGEATGRKRYKIPTLNNRYLFARDRWTCAYCGSTNPNESKLSCDHVVPRSRGGKDIWENVVTSCGPCNNFKDNWLLSEIGMELRYVPYVPTQADILFMESQGILPSQAEYLLPFCSERARLSFQGVANQGGPALNHLEEAARAAGPRRSKAPTRK